MPTVTIDGQEVTVEAGSTVIQAAEKLGIYIPRYCYHPGLSIAGSCRMCLVEVEQMPKLTISCHTAVQDGMKVATASEKVLQARKAMLEFLLTDHPLDCPVCDQAGECDLQNYYMELGQYDSRFLENKIKRKKAQPIGPHVMLDQERCILCTRCVRFCEEVSRTNELGVFNRGDRSVIDLYPDQPLDNPYSGNVIDICPVGALTEREFRFQCRVWYLSSQQSICPGCSRGCNINIHFNASRPYKAEGRRIQRLKPRFNPEVNRWWICDEGRFGYRFVDENRIEEPHGKESGRLEKWSWEKALSETTLALKTAVDRFGAEAVAVIASPQLSNEELHLFRKLFREGLGVQSLACMNPWETSGYEDHFLVRGEKHPNARGARHLGWNGDTRRLLQRADSGEVKVLYVVHHDFQAPEAGALLEKAEFVIFQGTNWNTTARISNVVLPGATFAEKDGTFTNFEGRVQRFHQAFLPLADARSDIDILLALSRGLGCGVPEMTAEELFHEWSGTSLDEVSEHGYMGDGR